MTENEKLRALLAEARECVRVNCPCCGKANCPEGSEPELSQRIDAALAEPVSVTRASVLEKALRASCGPGCSHEGEEYDPQLGIDYHAGWVALGDAKCGYCGQRHDAALAEPVIDADNVCLCESCEYRSVAQSLVGALTNVANERDEARAEVERLREKLEASAYEIARDMEPELVDGVIAKAYQRGAEAMREAAASCVGSDTALLQTYRSVLEGRIRDLPIPEDKP